MPRKKEVERETGTEQVENEIKKEELEEAGEYGEYDAMAEVNVQKLDDSEEIILPQQEFLDNLEEEAVSEESEKAIQETEETAGKPKRSGRKAKNMPEGLSEKEERVVTAGKKRKRDLYNGGLVMTKNGPMKMNQANSKRREEFLELKASAENGNIRTGKLISERVTENGFVLAEVAYGEYFTVCIMVPFLCDLSLQPKSFHDSVDIAMTKAYMDLIHRRIGAEIDFKVLQVVEKDGIAYASHVDAMVGKARSNFVYPRRNGLPYITTGMIVEASIMQVNTIGIWVEAFGIETFIKQDELDWLRHKDASEKYSVGDTVYIKILSVQPHQIVASERTLNTVKMEASVKRVRKNPNEEYFDRFKVDQSAGAIVEQITDVGIFVTYANKISVLCELPRGGDIPPIGSEVLVKIGRKMEENFRFSGRISYVIKVPEE